MLAIGEVLISDDIVESYFLCDLNACRGACCYEGDWGAPLEENEIDILESIIDKIKPHLSSASVALIEKKGIAQYYEELGEKGTTLHSDGSCVFLIKDENGISKCGIEHLYNQGKINFRKPISCHLYPIRRKQNKELKFDALNYDRWDICNPACQMGAKMKMPLYQFAKEALIRAYGEEFYEELANAARHLQEKKRKTG